MDLAVDVGQTGMRARWSTDGSDGTVHRVAAPGEHLAAPGAADRLIDRIIDVRALFAEGPVDRVLVGTTGFASIVAQSTLPRLIQRLGCVGGVIADDAVTAFLGAIGHRAGVTLIAGTGVVALASGADGPWRRAGGWGWAIDDEGGGFWLGRAGLAAAARAVDQDLEATPLLAAARERFGPPDTWPARVLASGAIATVASFAAEVVALGAAGDAEASALCQRAAVACARTAWMAARAMHADGPLAVTGALAPPGGLIDRYLEDALEAMAWRTERVPPLGSPLDGAAMLADPKVATRFDGLVVAAAAA